MTEKEQILLDSLKALVEATKPRIRSIANGFKYCCACQATWAHDAPLESHKSNCVYVAAQERLKG